MGALMKTREEIERRIEQCEFRSKEYFTDAGRANDIVMQDYWLAQSGIQDEIAHALKWAIGEEK